LVRGLWARGTDCIIDVRITDVDAKSQRSKDPLKVLEAHEREKKKKYLEACLEQRRHFSPFVASTDGLLGKESRTLLKKLSALLAEKWEKPSSQCSRELQGSMFSIRGSFLLQPAALTHLVISPCYFTFIEPNG
jgi:hypothetical protein